MFPIINREKGVAHLRLSKKAEPSAAGIAVKALWGGTRVNIVPNRAGCILAAKGSQLQELAELFNESSPCRLTVTKEDGGMKISAEGQACLLYTSRCV